MSTSTSTSTSININTSIDTHSSRAADRLYQLLPAIARQRDAEQGYPLQALLAVIGSQLQVLEDDIGRLYDNSFIETCEAWAVPYIGDLIAYGPQADAAGGAVNGRRAVAGTLGWRRRKGTLALLEVLAEQVARWPARALQCQDLLAMTAHLNYLHPQRGASVNLRDGRALDAIGSPFDQLAHTVDVRRVPSRRSTGRHNIPSVGLFVYRLQAYAVTGTPAYWHEGQGARCYSFSVLGNDAPLFIDPQRALEASAIAQPINLPQPIRRRWLGRDGQGAIGALVGEGLSFAITAPDWPQRGAAQPIPSDLIIAADLSDWRRYRVARGRVAVDPVLGRIAFPAASALKKGVSVSYHYGFSADIGGGEYPRATSMADGARLLRVGRGQPYATINAALKAWNSASDAGEQGEQGEQVEHGRVLAAVIEIVDSAVYTESLAIRLAAGESLQIRAASGARPVLRLLDQLVDGADALCIEGGAASRLLLEGLLVTGRGLRISGGGADSEQDGPHTGSALRGDLCDVRIRHCTLVPGWGVHCDCAPHHPGEASIELVDSGAQLVVEHCIIGAIVVTASARTRDRSAVAIAISISDSIVDATAPQRSAIAAEDGALAFATVRIVRCTVIGQVLVHALALAENCLFAGTLRVGRRQLGCMRFCHVGLEARDTRTPRRFACQPDLVRQPGAISAAELALETARVQPRWTSLRYGSPGYCQLHADCADEIRRGADDGSEMGVFHALHEAQRAASLRASVEQYSPAAIDAGIIYANQES